MARLSNIHEIDLDSAPVHWTQMDKSLLLASIDTYAAEIRKACEEDQGLADGRPGTVGRMVQQNLRDLREKVQREIIGY